MLYIYLPNMKL